MRRDHSSTRLFNPKPLQAVPLLHNRQVPIPRIAALIRELNAPRLLYLLAHPWTSLSDYCPDSSTIQTEDTACFPYTARCLSCSRFKGTRLIVTPHTPAD